jgi:hypothetical protein
MPRRAFPVPVAPSGSFGSRIFRGGRATPFIEGIRREKIRGCSYRERALRPTQCPLCVDSDELRQRSEMTRCAMNGSRRRTYSMTSSARVSSVGGTMMPSAFAVFKLITNSNLVGCSTGRSAGLAPLKILSTKAADRRNRSGRSGP